METYHDIDFLSTVYSEELFNTDPDELAEVQTLMAEPEPEWEGYGEWSEDLEAARWQGAQPAQTPHGTVLIKKACEHKSCPHTRCARRTRLEGFEI